MLFDTHGRPLPRFYDLTIERRAEAIATERCAWHAQRVRAGKRAFFIDISRLCDVQDESVAMLDVLPPRKSDALYERILLGEWSY
jgi:hypothetical protein